MCSRSWWVPVQRDQRRSGASHGTEPNTEDGHPKPGSFTPSDETTAGAPTLAVAVETGSVTGTAEAPLDSADAAEDAATPGDAALTADGDTAGVWMAGEGVEDPVELGPAGPGCTVPGSPALTNAQTVTTIPTATIALTIQIARADGLRERAG